MNKGIDLITYNYLNLPTEVHWTSGNTIEWMYSASGEKLRQTTYDNVTGTQVIRDYVNGIVYTNLRLDNIITSEGRLVNKDGEWEHEYHLKDHLGNTRVTFDETSMADSNKVKEKLNYYPFGLTLDKTTYAMAGSENKYQYNSKEMIDELGLDWYHYGTRYYDPQLGRWHVVDPVDEYHSPYVYVRNNPIRLLDKDGMVEEKAASVMLI